MLSRHVQDFPGKGYLQVFTSLRRIGICRVIKFSVREVENNMGEGEIKLGEWLIRCITPAYSLWKNSEAESVIVEYDSNKIATITLRSDGSLLVLSKNAYCEVNAEKHMVTAWSPNDAQIKLV